MKAIFIIHNQAYSDEILTILEQFGQRGFTRWTEVQGRGGSEGIPHLGNHAWPEQNYAVISFVPDEKVQGILDALKATDEATPDLGIRAFCWDIAASI